MIAIIVLIALVALIAESEAVSCWVNQARTLQGECTRRNDCTGGDAIWLKSRSRRGRRQAWGCERLSSRWRCCYERSANRPKPGPNPAPKPSPKPAPKPAPPAPGPKPLPQNPTLGTRQQAMLDFHNEERRCYGIPMMTWDNDLELRAKAYAAKCIWGHSPRSERRSPSQGENLAAGSGSWDAFTLLNGWLDEQFSWNCRGNSCAGGKVCGHYTQMIWADSTKLGCGAIVCHKGSPFGTRTWTNVVCRYGSAGNFIGRHPTGTGKCGSCARSARDEDDIWAPDADFQLCVPAGGANATETADAKCVCPDGDMGVDGPCTPEQLAPCTNAPKECPEGTVYPHPPQCVAECADGDNSAAAVKKGAAAFAAAALAGQALVL